ncbi:MAG: DUF6318 family protein [Tetrasphaera sp.]
MTPSIPTRTTLVALAAIVAVIVAGCLPDLTTGSSTGPTTRASATSLGPSEPESSPAATAYEPKKPKLPTAARRANGAGAAAFTGYFFELVGFAWAMPQTGLIEDVSLRDCQACANYAGEADRLISTHERFASDPLAVESVDVVTKTGDGYEIRADVEQLAARVYNLNGSLARKQASEALTMVVQTKWSSQGWRVVSVRKE